MYFTKAMLGGKYVLINQTSVVLRPVHTLPQAAGRKPHRVKHISIFYVFPLIAQWNPSNFTCVLRVYEHKRDCAYAHIKNHTACELQYARCGLCCDLRQSMPQAAARKVCAQAAWFVVLVRAIAFMFIIINTQHASEIAGNSIALLMELQRKLKYVHRGLRPSMNRPLAL